MKQIRITRRTRRSGGGGEPALDALPVVPASDTRTTAALLARIDAALAS